MKKLIILLNLSCFMPVLANAEMVPPLSLQHRASIEISKGVGTGNIDQQNHRLSGKLVSGYGRYTNELKGNISNLENSNGNSEVGYKIGERLKYEVTEGGNVFGEVERVGNKTSGVKSRTSELLGYEQLLIEKDGFDMSGEAGAGFRQSDYQPGLEDANSLLGKVGTDINWEFYKNVKLNNNSYMAYAEDNTQTVSDTSIKTFLYRGAYIKGAVEVENNSKVPVGYKKTDTVTSIGMGYDF